jgi:hypothetical protein
MLFEAPMKNRSLPRAFLVLVAAACAMPALALPSSSPPPPVRVEVLDDATLDSQTGKFFGADMLVGVRIELVSMLTTAQGASASAAGTLYIRRTEGGGFDVQVDSRALAAAGVSTAPATGNLATGGEQVRVDGIGQVTQIAGDGNRMSNVALVQLGTAPASPSGFNGQSGAQASAGGLQAQVSFVGGGLQIGLVAPGATIGQQVTTGASGRVMQIGQIAGDGFTASNALNLQMMTAAMPTSSLQQMGIQQALSAVSGLRH